MPTKLHIGNLPDKCSETTLRDLFSPYGDITDLVIIKNFAFVSFTEDKDASNALRDLNGAKLLGKQITVNISKNKGTKDKGGFVRNRGPQDKRGDTRNNQWNNFDNHEMESMKPNLSGLLGQVPSDITQPVLGDFGILSAVNTLAAVTEKQRSLAQMSMNSLSKNSNDDRRDMPSSLSGNSQLSSSSGYVIYERYYVDPKHPLLKGLPLPQLTSLNDIQSNITPKYPTDSYIPREGNRMDPYPKRNGSNRLRSPLASSGDGMAKDYINSYR